MSGATPNPEVVHLNPPCVKSGVIVRWIEIRNQRSRHSIFIILLFLILHAFLSDPVILLICSTMYTSRFVIRDLELFTIDDSHHYNLNKKLLESEGLQRDSLHINMSPPSLQTSNLG